MTIGVASWRDTLKPITFEVGFLEDELPDVCAAYLEWQGRSSRRVYAEEVTGVAISDALRLLRPLSSPPTSTLFWRTLSTWVAYFDNGLQGPDPVGPISYLTRALGCRGVVVVHVPHTLEEETGNERGTYGSTQFQLFSPARTDFVNFERTISASYDGGRWRFDTAGKIQPYEDPALYRNRRIQDRLTLSALENYCAALGINFSRDDFYDTRGCLMRDIGGLATGPALRAGLD